MSDINGRGVLQEPRHLFIFTRVDDGLRGASDISVTTGPMDRSDRTGKHVFKNN